MPCSRFSILFFNCLLTLGSYFCFDLPSTLQYWLQGNATCGSTIDNITADSLDCRLGLSPQEYNLLYAVSAWMDAAVVLYAGILVDKFGSRVCAILFSFLCLVGSGVFASGWFFRGTVAMLPIMLTGRLIFGSGNSSLSIVQGRLLAFWFRDRELAMAFGATLATSRFASVLNFAVTATLARKFGVMWALWAGTFLCAVSFLVGIALRFLGRMGIVHEESEARVCQETKEQRCVNVRQFSRPYWFLVLAVAFFYSSVYPFVANSSMFIHDKYGSSPEEAAYLTGAVYFISIISPFIGYAIDVFGKRGYLSFASSLLTVPVFALLAFTNVHPLSCTVWLGLTFTVTTVSLFRSIPLLVPQAAIGMAIGVNNSVQLFCVGISNVIVGAILGKTEGLDKGESLTRWRHVMMFLLCNVVLCILMTALMNLSDRRRERVLNQSNRERVSRLLIEEHLQHSDSGCYSDNHEPSEHEPLLNSRPFYSSEIN